MSNGFLWIIMYGPDEAQKTLTMLWQLGSHTEIHMITVNLDIKHDCYLAEFLIWD